MERKTKKRSKTIWIREYWYNYGIFAIKKYIAPVGWRNKCVTRYAVSKSLKRKSWYSDFNHFVDARSFGITLLRYGNGKNSKNSRSKK